MQKVEKSHFSTSGRKRDSTTTDISSIIYALNNFRKERLAYILEQSGFETDGEKEHLIRHITIALHKGTMDLEFVKDCVLSWEPWSRRHVFFFRHDELQQLDLETIVQEIPKEYRHLVGRDRRYLNSMKIEVESIEISPSKLKMFMRAPALIEIREQSEDEFGHDNGLKKYAYRDVKIRKIYVFELDIISGTGFVSIPSIQSKSKYTKEAELVLKFVNRIFPSLSLNKIQIRDSISNLRLLENIKNKGLDVHMGELKALFRSTSKKDLADEDIPEEVSKIIDENHLEEGIFEVGDLELKKICSMRIYKDSRLGIFRDIDEDEFRYVCETVLNNT